MYRPDTAVWITLEVPLTMETFVEKIYVEELITQCTWAIAAVARMNDILESNEQGRPQLFFRQAVELLQHSALASKLLWPPGGSIAFKNKRAKARGQHLRGVLQMPELHVLKSRSLRDHFEHYDERLDDWVANSPNRIFVDDVIGPRAWVGGVQDHEIFKLYDPQTKTLLFRGEPFDIQALVDGLSDVQKRAQTRLQALKK